jgi:hypothetical protein
LGILVRDRAKGRFQEGWHMHGPSCEMESE